MSQSTKDRAPVRLTSAPVVIRANGFVPVDYRMIREAAINGMIPAHQRNGIWHFYPEDAGQIVKALKLPRLAKTDHQNAA